MNISKKIVKAINEGILNALADIDDDEDIVLSKSSIDDKFHNINNEHNKIISIDRLDTYKVICHILGYKFDEAPKDHNILLYLNNHTLSAEDSLMVENAYVCCKSLYSNNLSDFDSSDFDSYLFATGWKSFSLYDLIENSIVDKDMETLSYFNHSNDYLNIIHKHINILNKQKPMGIYMSKDKGVMCIVNKMTGGIYYTFILTGEVNYYLIDPKLSKSYNNEIDYMKEVFIKELKKHGLLTSKYILDLRNFMHIEYENNIPYLYYTCDTLPNKKNIVTKTIVYILYSSLKVSKWVKNFNSSNNYSDIYNTDDNSFTCEITNDSAKITIADPKIAKKLSVKSDL